MEHKAGDILCNCTLLQNCGCGSYGEVWLAEDAIGTRVALKILDGRRSYSGRELSGLKKYKDCNHPNLLKIRHVEISENLICYTMDAADDLNCGKGEYLPDTLANRLNRFGRLDGREISAMIDDLLSGLEELHKHGLVHRDIKPDNIIRVNGRATLADVGLIADDGANSLVGSPGFLSPRVLAGHPAEASDDFYALGKVIYCALTGLSVSEYPSLPPEVTISIDADLNRALRESCSRPISSSAEFRQLLAGKCAASAFPKSPPRNFPLKQMLSILFVLAAAGGFVYLFSQQKKMEAAYMPQPVQTDPEDEKKLKQLLNAGKDSAAELQESVRNQFERMGFFSDNGKLLAVLLNYELLTREQMTDLLWHSNRNPRMQTYAGAPPKTAKTLSPVESKLFGILLAGYTPDFDAEAVKARQNFWRSRTKMPEQVQREMLSTDTLMQAVALDAVIRSGINTILRGNQLTENDEKELNMLLKLRNSLLMPEKHMLEHLGKQTRIENEKKFEKK